MSKRTIGSLQIILAATIFSFGGVLCKFLPWSSFPTAGLRSLLCALLFIPIRRSVKITINKANLLGALGVGGTSILYISSCKLTSAANAIVLQYTMPIFVILLSWLFYGQKPQKRDVITGVCILFGVALCSLSGAQAPKGHLLGDFLAVVGGVTFALVYFCSRLPGANSQEYNHLGFWFCAPVALFAIGDPSMSFTPVYLLAILGMAVSLSLGYYFIGRGLKNTTPVAAALLSNLEPILNPIWVFLFLGENPGAWSIVGAIIVIASTTIYSITGNKAA